MTRKYSSKSQKDVKKAMLEFKEGKLKSGKSGKKVTNPKQAVAIGLSKARKHGHEEPVRKSVDSAARRGNPPCRATHILGRSGRPVRSCQRLFTSSWIVHSVQARPTHQVHIY